MDRDTTILRWTAELQALASAYLSGMGTRPFHDLADGYADLRGMTISQFIKSSKLNRVDLSHACTAGFGQFGFCQLSDCRFTSAVIGTNLGNHFANCDFSSCNLSGAVLRGTFENCNFSLANLSAVQSEQASFVRCKFFHSNLRKASFGHCLFEDCSFEKCVFGSGSVAGSRFVRSPIALETLTKTNTENIVIA